MKPIFWQLPKPTLSPQQVHERFELLGSRLLEVTRSYAIVKFATSLAAEDMVLTDAIAKQHLPIQLQQG